ncbi:MAG: DUF1697 domain-containing protein [Ignavibacteria bacterium]
MIRYTAFLRGINVSGQKLIKMEDLKKIFLSMGFKNVQTYIQSGNVVFDTSGLNHDVLHKRIEKELNKSLGYGVVTILRTITEIERIINNNPFKKEKIEGETKFYVTMLAEKPTSKQKKELESFKDNVDKFKIINREVYILCYKGYGKSVFSNNFIEKKLGMPATSRNWNTINKILKV